MRNRSYRNLLLSLCVLIFSVLIACSRQPAGSHEANKNSPNANNNAANTATPSPSNPSVDIEPIMPLEVQAAFERSCKNCHGPDGHGIAAVAPDLRRAGRRTPEDWVKYLRDPKSVHPNSRMPAIESMTDEEYEAVGAYLADLTQHNAPAASAGPANQK
ncbi:MAG TPA: cytochrome c [Blastocatellia bacterium]|nr:cytochrome c [Blastocatellia bacterium]